MKCARPSRRFSAVEASRRMFGDGNNDETTTSSEESDESESVETEDSDHGEVSVEEQEWNLINAGEDVFVPSPTFAANSGISTDIEIPENVSENVNFFVQLFLTDELFEMLSAWTNKRAQIDFEKCDTDPDADLPAFLSKWRPVNAYDMKKLLGILLCMQLNHKPEIRNYWSRNIIYKSALFQDPRCLSRNRFEDILRYLRFSDYENLDCDDNLCKIRPFLTFVQERCKKVYLPCKAICIDESLLLYKGRLQFRRYIPSKRARYGILSYCLCESSTGYTWNVQIAAGRCENERWWRSVPQTAQNFTFSEKIVIVLLSDLIDKGYHVFVDNFFCSVRLAQFLYERKTLLTGTLRVHRGVPNILKNMSVAAKSHAFCRKKEVLIVKAVDRKASGLKTLYVADTAQKAGTTVRRRVLRGGVAENIEKSWSVLSYNSGMGGVDARDGSLHPYNMSRKSYKWFTKLAIHFTHVLLKNSWVVFRSCGGTMDFLSFQEKVVEDFILNTGEGRRGGPLGGRPAMRPSLEPQPCLHAPKRLSPRPNRPRPSKKCRVCHREGRRKETVFVCSECPTLPALCADPCFRIFHAY